MNELIQRLTTNVCAVASVQTNFDESFYGGYNMCPFTPTVAQKDILALEHQIKDLGGELNGVASKQFGPSNNGIVATEDAKSGDVLMFIPREIIITLDEAEKSKLFDRLIQKKVLKKLQFTNE